MFRFVQIPERFSLLSQSTKKTPNPPEKRPVNCQKAGVIVEVKVKSRNADSLFISALTFKK